MIIFDTAKYWIRLFHSPPGRSTARWVGTSGSLHDSGFRFPSFIFREADVPCPSYLEFRLQQLSSRQQPRSRHGTGLVALAQQLTQSKALPIRIPFSFMWPNVSCHTAAGSSAPCMVLRSSASFFMAWTHVEDSLITCAAEVCPVPT